jgi:hypothetical protein
MSVRARPLTRTGLYSTRFRGCRRAPLRSRKRDVVSALRVTIPRARFSDSLSPRCARRSGPAEFISLVWGVPPPGRQGQGKRRRSYPRSSAQELVQNG